MEKTPTTLFPCLFLFSFYLLVACNRGKQLYLLNKLAAVILPSCQEGKLISFFIFGLFNFSFCLFSFKFWVEMILRRITHVLVKFAKYEDLERNLKEN